MASKLATQAFASFMLAAAHVTLRSPRKPPSSAAAAPCCCLNPSRSFQGFSCLLQLSTRSADWVVDCLALRGQLGPALAPLLADSAVEKVLHGADSDVLWLQVGRGEGGGGGGGSGMQLTAP
jgi:hypothetical protein